jgi:hypothetical protein
MQTQGKLYPQASTRMNEGGELLVAGAAPALTKRTASVEPAGKAERAAAAKSKALAPWTQSETRREVDTLCERQARSR